MKVKTKELEIAPKEDWSCDQIQAAMRAAGVRQYEIARLFGVTDMAISMVVRRGVVSHRIRTAIAEAIGVDVAEIWPSYYRAERSRLGRKLTD
jgi:lambda repressor-like predicted transcriptional regulator